MRPVFLNHESVFRIINSQHLALSIILLVRPAQYRHLASVVTQVLPSGQVFYIDVWCAKMEKGCQTGSMMTMMNGIAMKKAIRLLVCESLNLQASIPIRGPCKVPQINREASASLCGVVLIFVQAISLSSV
jgi:hypothetical protein